MYEPKTVLVLKAPKDPDPETGTPFPYNRVRVIGPSPVTYSGQASQWQGGNAQGVLIEPLTAFGANLDEAYGKLIALYDVESTPDPEIPITTPKVDALSLKRAQPGPSPEEVFAAHRAENPDDPDVKPAWQDLSSPLEDPRKPANASPLDG